MALTVDLQFLNKIVRNRFFRIFRSAAVVFLTFYILAAVGIIADGVTDSARKSDVIIVLGNEVLSNGTPSNRLEARLDKAVELYGKSFASHIIVSGGVGKTGFNETDSMANYLVSKNVPVEAIIRDRTGVTTRATAKNAATIMKQEGWNSAIVVSQYYHMSRSRLAHKRAGIHTVTTAHADYIELRDAYSLLREVPAFMKYYFTS